MSHILGYVGKANQEDIKQNPQLKLIKITGKNGVEKINELDLNQEEKEWFDKGVNSVKNALSGIDIWSFF